jgi:hypothetical protein
MVYFVTHSTYFVYHSKGGTYENYNYFTITVEQGNSGHFSNSNVKFCENILLNIENSVNFIFFYFQVSQLELQYFT